MTRKETLQMLAILKAAYPAFYRGMVKEELEDIVNLWQSMFDEPSEVVAAAVKTLIATDVKGYPPHIGAVKEQIRLLMTPDMMTEQEAWTLVADTVVRYGGYGAQEGFDRLPPLLRTLVGSPSQLTKWGQMDESSFNSVVASNFQRSYRAAVEKQIRYEKAPAEAKRLMNGADKPLLEGEAEHGA